MFVKIARIESNEGNVANAELAAFSQMALRTRAWTAPLDVLCCHGGHDQGQHTHTRTHTHTHTRTHTDARTHKRPDTHTYTYTADKYLQPGVPRPHTPSYMVLPPFPCPTTGRQREGKDEGGAGAGAGAGGGKGRGEDGEGYANRRVWSGEDADRRESWDNVPGHRRDEEERNKEEEEEAAAEEEKEEGEEGGEEEEITREWAAGRVHGHVCKLAAKFVSVAEKV